MTNTKSTHTDKQAFVQLWAAQTIALGCRLTDSFDAVVEAMPLLDKQFAPHLSDQAGTIIEEEK